MERGTPIGTSLEDRQMLSGLSHFLYQLYGRGSRADYTNSLSGKDHFLVRPTSRMERGPFKVVHALKIGDQWFR